MRAKLPVIKPASDTPGPRRDRLWDKLKTQEEKDFLIKLMRKRGNTDWNPGEVIEIESKKEIAKIMEQPPVGKQAIVTGGR
jgi:hypothetical protein